VAGTPDPADRRRRTSELSTTRRTFLVGALGLGAAACAAPEGFGDTNPAPAPAVTRSSTTTTTAPPPPPPPPPSPRFVTEGPTTAPRVALTFHTDGRLDLAARMVEQLGGTPGTCFVVGSWLQKNPEWAGRLTGAGLELANHTYTHPSSTKLDSAALTSEITRCRDLLQKLTGSPGRFFRPSGTDDGMVPPGPSIMAAAAAAGYAEVVGFGVDPLDYKDPGTDAVVSRTLATVGPGAIVSLHFGHPGTVAALPAIRAGLRDRGLEPVPLGALLG
jgi:peptidoglycan/xylan/chitin deacetylase (PgdA/CDA1 family)